MLLRVFSLFGVVLLSVCHFFFVAEFVSKKERTEPSGEDVLWRDGREKLWLFHCTEELSWRLSRASKSHHVYRRYGTSTSHTLIRLSRAFEPAGRARAWFLERVRLSCVRSRSGLPAIMESRSRLMRSCALIDWRSACCLPLLLLFIACYTRSGNMKVFYPE